MGFRDRKPNRLYSEVEQLRDRELAGHARARVEEQVRTNETAAEYFHDIARIGELIADHNRETADRVDLSGVWAGVRFGIQTPQVEAAPSWIEWLRSRSSWALAGVTALCAAMLTPLAQSDAPPAAIARTQPSFQYRTIEPGEFKTVVVNPTGVGMPVLYYYSQPDASGAPGDIAAVAARGMIYD